MDILPFYTVEFKMRSSHIAKRTISDKILNEFLDRVQSRSKSFRRHPSPIGFQDNKRVGFVYFYSDLSFGDIYRTAEYFAEEKRYEFFVKQKQLTEEKKPLNYPLQTSYSNGGIIGIFNKRISLNDLLFN